MKKIVEIHSLSLKEDLLQKLDLAELHELARSKQVEMTGGKGTLALRLRDKVALLVELNVE